MEVDLDKDEVVRAEGDEQSGEKLLSEYLSASAKPRRRVRNVMIHYSLSSGQKLTSEENK